MIIRPRSPSLLYVLFTLRGSILPATWKRLCAIIVLAFAVVVVDRYLLRFNVELSASPLTLIGLTLAIFLGFRNNVAYQRWWEARTLWGELVIVLRNLARQTLSLLPDEAPSRQTQIRRLIGYAHALRLYLRDEPLDEVAPWVSAAEFARLRASPMPPNLLLSWIDQHYAEALRRGALDSIQLASLQQQLSRASYVLGGCERIKGTPLPYAYLLLLHRTVYTYCFLTPFCLVSSLGWLTPFVVGVLAYTFFGLDVLGDQIEDPFARKPNNLALDALCRTIEISLLEIAGDTELPAALQPVEGVLL